MIRVAFIISLTSQTRTIPNFRKQYNPLQNTRVMESLENCSFKVKPCFLKSVYSQPEKAKCFTIILSKPMHLRNKNRYFSDSSVSKHLLINLYILFEISGLRLKLATLSIRTLICSHSFQKCVIEILANPL